MAASELRQEIAWLKVTHFQRGTSKMAMFSIVFVGMYVCGGRLVKGGLGLDGRGVLVGSPRTKNLLFFKKQFIVL